MEEKKNKGHRKAWAIAGAVLMLALVHYILSVGPALWLWSWGYLSNEAIRTAYAPLFSIIARSEWAKEAFPWYIAFWLPA